MTLAELGIVPGKTAVNAGDKGWYRVLEDDLFNGAGSRWALLSNVRPAKSGSYPAK